MSKYLITFKNVGEDNFCGEEVYNGDKESAAVEAKRICVSHFQNLHRDKDRVTLVYESSSIGDTTLYKVKVYNFNLTSCRMYGFVSIEKHILE
jgi:hypothetical protein